MNEKATLPFTRFKTKVKDHQRYDRGENRIVVEDGLEEYQFRMEGNAKHGIPKSEWYEVAKHLMGISDKMPNASAEELQNLSHQLYLVSKAIERQAEVFEAELPF
tara:strand:- start:6839 stop:7153 length:315 start_codon:yes stop_codon:yes gene_type:complete